MFIDRYVTLHTDEIADYWAQHSAASVRPSRLQLQMEMIPDVLPLDAQFGVDRPIFVPDALFPVMFAQPEELEDDRRFHTYALLDAAKVPALPEMLAVSGLEHRCLFKGSSYEKLKDAAPWIVRLEDDNRFTRNLFTRSDTPWHLWDAEPGLYLRSRGTLDQIWQHLRKFTRVRDEAGKWFYFRFWEIDCLIDYIGFAEKHNHSDLRPLFGFDAMDSTSPLVQNYMNRNQNTVRTCTVTHISADNAGIPARIDIPILRFLALRSHARSFVDSYYIGQDARPDAPALQGAKEFCTALVQKYHSYGFKSRYHLGSFVYWALALNGDFETRLPNLQIHIHQTDADPNDRFVLMARQIKHVFGSRVRNYRGYGS
ncbi:hypothetical protein NHU_02314 [Rhodovulum sulfidophilum]|uniref:DUF4123 domain-containing protein n=1 Tax=Rhodovulum sulfidophilum TaxID=35806 RepID=A0A0D6B349_RHOSU|nr:hypothetical protein NHU_02314 [Rhodovulum sulfidophilum]